MKIWIYPLSAIGLALILIISCKKSEQKPDNPTNDKTTALFNSQLTYGSLTDQDGNVYKTISIGTQTWMAENLRTTHYSNGDPIPEVTGNTPWIALNTGAYCNYNNSQNNDTIATFGRLYNWHAISDIRNIAPIGWHIPSESEWNQLKLFLDSDAGGKLKEAGIVHWIVPNTGATNESGFTALPGGSRLYTDGSYNNIGEMGEWWSSSQSTNFVDNAIVAVLFYNYADGGGSASYNKANGYSVRCVKDN